VATTPFIGEHLTTLPAFAQQHGLDLQTVLTKKARSRTFPKHIYIDDKGAWYVPAQLRDYFRAKGMIE
jgi:hypothetical protein